MAQTPIVETKHNAEFLVSQANGHRSFDQGILISGQNLVAGTVLGIITASGKWTQFASAASDGSQNPAGILYANVNASASDTKSTIVTRAAEVNASELTWPNGLNNAGITAGIAALKALGIVAR